MNISRVSHLSHNQWWRIGLRTLSINWPSEFNSKRLVNDYNASQELQKEKNACGHICLWQF